MIQQNPTKAEGKETPEPTPHNLPLSISYQTHPLNPFIPGAMMYTPVELIDLIQTRQPDSYGRVRIPLQNGYDSRIEWITVNAVVVPNILEWNAQDGWILRP